MKKRGSTNGAENSFLSNGCTHLLFSLFLLLPLIYANGEEFGVRWEIVAFFVYLQGRNVLWNETPCAFTNSIFSIACKHSVYRFVCNFDTAADNISLAIQFSDNVYCTSGVRRFWFFAKGVRCFDGVCEMIIYWFSICSCTYIEFLGKFWTLFSQFIQRILIESAM